MAGDIGVDEQVIVVSAQARELAAEIAASANQQGGRVVHRYGARVMIGEIPEHRSDQVRASIAPHTAEVAATPQQLAPQATAGLDEIGSLGLAAFSLRQSREYIAAKAQRPHQNAKWDTGGALRPPDPPPEYGHLVASAALENAAEAPSVSGNTSQQMTGSIAV